MELLREELERTNVQTRDSVVAKMAALSGKLNLRFDVIPSGMANVSHMPWYPGPSACYALSCITDARVSAWVYALVSTVVSY